MSRKPKTGQPAKRKVRVFTWVILAINVLFLIWVIAGAASSSGDAGNCGGLDQKSCNDAEDVGTAIGVFLIVIFWAAVDVILGIIWLVTRKRQPTVIYVQQPSSSQAGPGWFPDREDPQQLRWWDGNQFTDHTRPA